MRLKRKGLKLLALFLGLSLVAAGCGDDDDEGGEDNRRTPRRRRRRRRRVHRPRHLRRRPARAHRPGAEHHARRVPGHQRPLRRPDRDRLHRPGQPRDRAARGRVLRGERRRHGVDLHHQGGPRVLQRRGDPAQLVQALLGAAPTDFAGDYSYLFNFIEGGAEKLDGTADTISGVVADDEAMTLTVTLDAPVRQLPGGGRLPAVLPDARRRPSRPARTGRTGS